MQLLGQFLATATRRVRMQFPPMTMALGFGRRLLSRSKTVATESVPGNGPIAAAASNTTGSVEMYSRGMQAFHWLVGAGMLTCVATVKMAQWTDDKKKKGQYMLIHKSTALLVAALVIPRIAVRLTSKLPVPVPGTSSLEKLAANVSHLALYAAIVGMPATGIAMGYFGGKGLPFFVTHIPGSSTPNGSVAKTAFKIHKKMGQVLEYLIPLHVAATVFHITQGVQMFARMGFGLSASSATTSTSAAAIALALASSDTIDVEDVDGNMGNNNEHDEA
eukprot:gene2102-8003_t